MNKETLMAYTFLTDSRTKINNPLVTSINANKNIEGQILYTLDTLSSNNKNIIYLTNDDMFETVSLISKKVSNIHTNKIIVINIANIDKIDEFINNFDDDNLSSLKETFNFEFNIYEQYIIYNFNM